MTATSRVFSVGAIERFWSPRRERWCVTVGTGACYVTDDNDVLTTVLGSCIAACVHDPVRGLGGMNHFLLPSLDREGSVAAGMATRYGAHAMELLVNEVMKAGAHRGDLEVKLFGGAAVTGALGDSGHRNIAFVRHYVEAEGLRLRAADLGDEVARRVEFHPRSGKARVRRLPSVRAPQVSEQERRYLRDLERTSYEGEIELF